jgi:hypothetical protein
MQRKARNILRSSDVKLEGRFHLDVDPINIPSPQKKAVNSATPQVHIVESHPEFAVLELTCLCGNKSYIRCEYDNAQSVNHEPEQTKTNEENNNAN